MDFARLMQKTVFVGAAAVAASFLLAVAGDAPLGAVDTGIAEMSSGLVYGLIF